MPRSAASYDSCLFPVRRELEEAHAEIWADMASPGTWWTGAERVAIASEVRRAATCEFCRDRKAALAPGAVVGNHTGDDILPAPLVDAIHKVTTDPGRMSREVYERWLADGLEDAHYVEALGVVVRAVAIDSFCRALGLPLHPLPEPVAGEPSRRRPPSAAPDVAWMPLVPNDETFFDETGLRAPVPNVFRALGLVPAEVRSSIGTLLTTHYIEPPTDMRKPAHRSVVLTPTQVELLAARVSAINECFY